jgi:diguanylate cyclase (GGDEF)-like protein
LTQNLGVIDLTLRGLLENDAADPVVELARAIRHAPYLRSLSLIDATGRIIASSNSLNVGYQIGFNDVLPPIDAGGDVLRLGRPREGRDFYDSHPIPDRGTDPAARIFFTAIRSITWRGNDSWLAAAINTDYFINHYAYNVEAQRGAVEVFRYDATLVFSTHEQRPPGLINPEAAVFHSGVPPKIEIGEFTKAPLADLLTLGAYRASRRFPLVVAMHIPYDYVLAEWRKDRDSVLHFVLPTLAILLLLGVVALRHLHRLAAERLHAEQAEQEYQRLSEQMRVSQALQVLLQEQVLLDPLTGLHNRRYLNEIAERELARARHKGTPVTLAMLDVDHFKAINDTYGHPGGDRILVELAELLRAQTRPTDIVCRIGGEEFLLMLPNLPLGAAVERAEQLRQAFATMPIGFGEQVLGATVSIGLAGYPEHSDTLDSLIRRADEALYVAKREGRNRVAIAPLLFTESGKPLPSLPIDTDYP